MGPPFTDRVDVERLFARARTCFIDGIEVLTLCPDDALLHLCLHATHQHGFNNEIRPLYDLVAVLDQFRRELDWKQVVSRSRKWGAGECLFVALSVADHIAGESVPDGVWAEMDDYRGGADAVRRAEQLLFEPATAPGNMARLFDDISVGEKLVFLASRVAPIPKTMPEMNMNREDTSSLGSSPLWLRYLLRIKGLVGRNGRLAWTLFPRDKHAVMGARTEHRRSAERLARTPGPPQVRG